MKGRFIIRGSFDFNSILFDSKSIKIKSTGCWRIPSLTNLLKLPFI